MEKQKNSVQRLDISLIEEPKHKIKEQDTKLQQKLLSSISKRGQLKNIVVCETGKGTYECLEGYKIVTALKELGENEVLAMNLGLISEQEKNIVRLEVSKDFFLTNYSVVGNILKELQKEFKLPEVCNSIPYDTRNAEHLINMTEFDWEDFARNKQIEGQGSLFDMFEEEIVEEVIQKEQEIVDSFIPVIEPEIINEVKQNVLETKPLIETINTEGEKDTITQIIDDKIKETYPANVEGSKEFNEINQVEKEFNESYGESYEKAVTELIEEKQEQEKKEEYVVYLDSKLQHQVILLSEYMLLNPLPETLIKGTYKECYTYIINNI